VSAAETRGDTLAVDIEVVAPDWSAVDESTRGMLLEREKDDAKRQVVPEQLALYPGLGKVVAIGMWNVEKQLGALLLEGEGDDAQPWTEMADRSWRMRAGERDLLVAFWQRLTKYARVVTFNGRGYDGPVLMLRSAILGVAPSRNLAGNRYRVDAHCDLQDVLSFHGATKPFKLEYWCRRFGVESPKSDLDGSQVGRAYKDGQIERIGEYCLRDARATAELYAKLQGTLLPLFGGA
jgi:DNA polymerase elongation subunit (family B)